MSKLDKILEHLQNQILEDARLGTKEHIHFDIAEAKAQLIQYMLEIIGEDEPEPFSTDPTERMKTHTARAKNSLKASQRERLLQLNQKD
jgi:hypothetical protein